MRQLGTTPSDQQREKDASEAIKNFLEKMDRFHLMAQKIFGSALATYNFRQVSHTESSNSTVTNSPGSNASAASSGLTNYWLAAFIALIYGMLGLCVLGGIFIYAGCSGKAASVGWKNIFLDNVVSGNKLQHFLAHLVCVLGGVTGLVAVAMKENENAYYAAFVLPVFLFLASVLNTRAMKSSNLTPNESAELSSVVAAGAPSRIDPAFFGSLPRSPVRIANTMSPPASPDMYTPNSSSSRAFSGG